MSGNQCSITMNKSPSVTANFEPVTTAGADLVLSSLSGSSAVPVGGQISLAAGVKNQGAGRKGESRMARTVKKHRGVFERPKGSGVWWICYFDQLGKNHPEKVGMKSAALTIYQQRKREVRHGKFEPEDVKGKHLHATVSEIIKDRLEVSKALKTAHDEETRLEWWRKDSATDQRVA
jgi:hypothetical protein